MGKFSSFLVLALLFPLFSRCERKEVEKTIAMVKPDGVLHNHTNKIKSMILESGFSILKEMKFEFDVNNAKLFYAEHLGKSFFPRLIEYMTSGPVFVMVLEKPNAISDLRYLIGPTDSKKAKISHPDSIRAMCGSSIERNCIHGSDSSKSAGREISFFFGKMLFGSSMICLLATKIAVNKEALSIMTNFEKRDGWKEFINSATYVTSINQLHLFSRLLDG